MSWLALGVALLGVAKAVFQWIAGRDSGDAAKAELILKGLRSIDERMANAEAARDGSERAFDAHGLPDDDPYRRD